VPEVSDTPTVPERFPRFAILFGADWRFGTRIMAASMISIDMPFQSNGTGFATGWRRRQARLPSKNRGCSGGVISLHDHA